jgi:hypothetical protein
MLPIDTLGAGLLNCDDWLYCILALPTVGALIDAACPKDARKSSISAAPPLLEFDGLGIPPPIELEGH